MWNVATRLAHTIPPDVPGAAVTAVSTADQPNMWLYLLGGGSLVTIASMLGSAFKTWYSGRGQALIRRDASLVDQRDTAWRERDEERTARQRAERNQRRVESHAGQLVYLLNKYGVPADEIPDYPRLEQDKHNSNET